MFFFLSCHLTYTLSTSHEIQGSAAAKFKACVVLFWSFFFKSLLIATFAFGQSRNLLSSKKMEIML
jgi:hypothetical protein